MKKRGYVVLPNPLEPHAIKAFKEGSFKEFERHSRVGMVTEKDFMKRVKELRNYGAKHVFLKTGAYRPAHREAPGEGVSSRKLPPSRGEIGHCGLCASAPRIRRAPPTALRGRDRRILAGRSDPGFCAPLQQRGGHRTVGGGAALTSSLSPSRST